MKDKKPSQLDYFISPIKLEISNQMINTHIKVISWLVKLGRDTYILLCKYCFTFAASLLTISLWFFTSFFWGILPSTNLVDRADNSYILLKFLFLPFFYISHRLDLSRRVVHHKTRKRTRSTERRWRFYYFLFIYKALYET